MAEYIDCRRCDSRNCDGCNILTLAKMFYARKFDCLLDEHNSINQFVDVEPVKHGRWEKHRGDVCYWWECSECHDHPARKSGYVFFSRYCPNCGAKMEWEV